MSKYINVKLPKLGETMAEATVTSWLKRRGESVEVDEPLFEVSSDKVDSEILSAVAGVVEEILVEAGDTADAGTVVAVIKVEGESPLGEGDTGVEKNLVKSEAGWDHLPKLNVSKVPASPMLRKLMSQNLLEINDITPTGPGGRIVRADIMKVIDGKDNKSRVKEIPVNDVNDVNDANEVRVPLSKTRISIAEATVRSLQVSPHVYTSIEVDFENISKVKQEEGLPTVKLGYLPFIARAVVDALAAFPAINASINDNTLIMHKEVHLNIAVGLDSGVIIPVIKNAEDLGIRAIGKAVSAIKAAAAEGKARSSLGTFTITNMGVVGTAFTLPIINQPQVAILASDAITKKPVVIGDAIAIRRVGNLTLGWDHRAFDGLAAGQFLRLVKEILETRDWLVELR